VFDEPERDTVQGLDPGHRPVYFGGPFVPGPGGVVARGVGQGKNRVVPHWVPHHR
jgi:hypothetical protein